MNIRYLTFLIVSTGTLGCRTPATAPEVGEAAVVQAEATADPVTVLAAAAESLDISVRGRAVYLTVRYDPAPGGGDAAPRGLYDPSPHVQQRTIEALESRIHEPEARDLLGAFVAREGVDPYAAGAAGAALARAGDHGSLPELQAAYRSAPTFWEAAPTALAAAMMGDPEGLRVVTVALERGEFPLELGFFDDCGRSDLPELAPALIAASERVEEELTLAIAAALVRLDASRGEVLFRQALNASDLERSMEAVDYLRTIDGPAAESLLRKARTGGPDALRQYARLALMARGEEPLELAWRALESTDREARLQAVQALGLYGQWRQAQGLSSRDDRKIHRALIATLQDPEEVVVMETLQALARVGGPDDQSVIAPLLEAELVAVQVEAAGAMLIL